MRFFLKVLISSLVIAGVSELGKRSTPLAAILAALPLTSLLAMVWLYADTQDVGQVAALSTSIFWAVLPTFLFFLSFPLLVRQGVRFAPALGASVTIMVLGYFLYVGLLRRFGVQA